MIFWNQRCDSILLLKISRPKERNTSYRTTGCYFAAGPRNLRARKLTPFDHRSTINFLQIGCIQNECWQDDLKSIEWPEV